MFGELQEYLGEGVVRREGPAGRERFNREDAMARGGRRALRTKRFLNTETQRQGGHRERFNREDAMAQGGRRALRAKKFLNTETQRHGGHRERFNREDAMARGGRRALRAYAEISTISGAALRVLWIGIFYCSYSCKFIHKLQLFNKAVLIRNTRINHAQ